MNMSRYLKCLSSVFFSLILLIMLPLSAFADGELTRQSDGSYTLFDGSTLSGVLNRGVDVSHWQGTIDWKAAAANDVKFAMLGTRYKGAVDPNFDTNAKGAVNNGISLGIYLYSYAMNTDEAGAEADFVLNLIKDYPVSYPVAYDVEDETSQGTLSKSDLTAIIKTFCEKIRAAGYYPILYANDYWLINKLDMNALKSYPVWVAAYQRMHNWSNPVMWQATSSGNINGFSGNVDIDLQFTDFSGKIPADTWREIGGTSYYYKNYSMQKNTLINDGRHSYFLNADGTVYKGGAKTLNGNSYYFDTASGEMFTGWMQNGDVWNYYGDSGLAKGWIKDKESWYFLDNSGAMKTGWITDNGQRYFLTGSGAMATGLTEADGKNYLFGNDGSVQKNTWYQAGSSWYLTDKEGTALTGWAEQNGTWYLLGDDGAMKTGWQKSNDTWFFLNSDGTMKTGWCKDNNEWYYLGSSGAMHTGIINADNVLYALADDGHMLHDTTVEYNGETWVIGSDGAMKKQSGGENAGTGNTGNAASSAPSSSETSGTAPASSSSSGKPGTVSPSGGSSSGSSSSGNSSSGSSSSGSSSSGSSSSGSSSSGSSSSGSSSSGSSSGKGGPGTVKSTTGSGASLTAP
jgi:glucan-binding YG repeat protein